MHYYLYQITNLVNNKIYVGVHKTKNLDDGYMGSGKVIKRAIEKHGIDNFVKVILETFENAEAMYAREKEVVTEEFLAREDVYNLRRGGFGGFDYINKTKTREERSKAGSKARNSTNKKLKEKFGKDWQSIVSSIGGKSAKSRQVGIHSPHYCNPGTAHMNTLECIEKKRKVFAQIKHQQGPNNSNFGKVWITDGLKSKMIQRESTIPLGWRVGRVLRK